MQEGAKTALLKKDVTVGPHVSTSGCSRRGGRGSRCCCCRCRRSSAAAVAYGSLPAGMPARRWHNPRRGRAGRGQLLARRRCRGAGTAEAGGGEAGGPPQLRGRRERGRRRAPRRHCPCPAVAQRPRGPAALSARDRKSVV